MHRNIIQRFILALGIAVLTISPGFAQTRGLPVPGIPFTMPFPEDLQRYLGLTADQIARIDTANQQFTQSVSTKAQRQIQLQLEIAQEMARPALDAHAIGVRYVEVEQIRRDIEAERTRTVVSVQSILNEAQKTKLTALQQVLRDYPIACAAIGQNLIAAGTGVTAINPNLPTQITGGITGSFASFLLSPSPACPVPVAASRVGTSPARVRSEPFQP